MRKFTTQGGRQTGGWESPVLSYNKCPFPSLAHTILLIYLLLAHIA